jgi:MoaA/NifB/PqqE/SkfB family radical SAM enzyme
MNRWNVALQNAPIILQGIYEYHIASRLGPLKPREWLFPVTYRCDARCVMCNIWQSSKGNELGLDEWSKVLDDPLFSGIESVNLSGGEPTLRQDLPQLTGLLLEKLPALRRLTVTTNALSPERVAQQCTALLDLCTDRGIRLFVGISLDGIGGRHDEMRNIVGAFDKATRTVGELQALQPRGLRVGINSTLTGRNLDDAREIREWGLERGLPVNFIVASYAESYYGNTECADELSFRPEQKTELVGFLQELGRARSLGNLAAYFYADAARMLERGSARTTPCVFQKDAFMLDARGDFQYCMYGRVLGNVRATSARALYYGEENLEHREEIIHNRCRDCTITCFLELGLAKDALRYGRFLLRGAP